MIGHIRGVLTEKQPPILVLETNGIGYEIEASMQTFYKLPGLGEELQLFTHFVVREDAQLLFGFYHRKERSLFRTLIKANGVGPKLAIAILSGMSTEEFAACILREDAATLTKIPGVGKKTAERLVVEFKDKIALLGLDEPADFTLTGTELPSATASINGYIEDAQSALIALGYKPVLASRAVSAAQQQLKNINSAEELIRIALKSMVG
ncbi:MAG: Holliday junction branch migration protein RuvA [Oceanospirillaceae bacterium]|nr:Holliday junction branch migration protein RuvA [Oceanospirillaceae bacterium]